MIRIFRPQQYCLPLICLLLCGGCGGPISQRRASVSGQVTLDGKPLKEGTVRFVPAAGNSGPKVSVPVDRGRFSTELRYGPMVGTNRVEIVSRDTGGLELDDEEAIDRLKGLRGRRIAVERVPAKYNSRTTLTVEISPDEENELEFALSSKN
ncbi:MAG: hypothetical protein ACE361_01795 [Aureliella sp.]